MKHNILKHQDSCMPHKDYNEQIETKETIEKLEIIENLCDEKKEALVKTMLLESSTKGYADLRKAITECHNVDIKSLPSLHLATKHRVPADSGILEICKDCECLMSEKDMMHLEKSSDENDHIGKKNKVLKKYFCKINGGYEKTCFLLHNKVRNRINSECLSNLVLFDSFNGANYLETTEGKVDLVSYSSTCFNQDLISLQDVVPS